MPWRPCKSSDGMPSLTARRAHSEKGLMFGMIIAPSCWNRFARRCPHHAAMPHLMMPQARFSSRGVVTVQVR